MKILFSNAPWWEAGSPPRMGIRAGSRWPFTRGATHSPDNFRFGGYLPFPFFLAYAAAYTAKVLPRDRVSIRDSIARGESYGSFFLHLGELRPDFLVWESASPAWEHDARVLRYIADHFPEIRVILCGPLDAARHADILASHRNVHAIVQGEYDKQIATAVAGPSKVYPHALLTREEMNDAPFPMWDEACASHYWDGCPIGQQPTQLQVWTSRGCPHKCIFCVWPATMTGNDPDGTRARAVRYYSPGYVEGMIMHRLAVARLTGHPVKSIYLDDDTFNLGDKHTLAICEVMQRIGLPWSAMCRADSVKRETWQVMKDAGCFGVKLGFESGNQHVVDHIVNKRLDLTAASDTVRFLKSIGMTVHGTFTMGLPGETNAQREDTAAFIRSLPFDSVQVSGTAEIEGTPLATLRQRGHLEKYDGASLNGYDVHTDGQKKIEGLSR